MKIHISLSPGLRELADNTAAMETEAKTVREVIDHLTTQYPKLLTKLFRDGKPNRFVNIFVNDEDIRYLDGWETAMKEHDNVSFLGGVAGG